MKSNLKNINQVVLQAAESSLLSVLQDIEAEVVDYFETENINDQGWLRDSVSSEITREVSRILGKIGSGAEYGVYVHQGTKPHWPPVDPIRDWVMHKLNVRGAEVSSVTWFVRKKISEEGTEGQPYLGFILKQYRNSIARLVGEKIKLRLNQA